MLNQLNLSGRRRLPVIRQSEGAECGLACIAMISGYHGFETDLVSLRRRFPISLRGSSLPAIMKIAEDIGFETRPLKVEIDAINKICLPAILHWNLNHYVILKSVSSKRVTIHDPARGERRISFRELSQSYTGIALELLPGKSFTKRKEKTPLRLHDLWGRIRGFKRSVIQAFSLSVILQVFVLIAPYYLQLTVDEVLVKFDEILLISLAVGFIGITAFDFITNILRGHVLLYMGSMLSYQVVGNLFRHLLRLPLAFFEKRHIGDLVSRFASTENIRTTLTEGLVAGVIDGLMASTTLILMFAYSPLLAAVSFGAMALYMIFRLSTFHVFRDRQEDFIVAKAKESSLFMESVRGIATIKLFARESDRERVWSQQFATSLNANARYQKFNIWFEALDKGIFGLELVILVYLAATKIMAAEFTIGMLMAFLAYRQSFNTSASSFIRYYIEYRLLDLHLERIADIVHTTAEPANNRFIKDPVELKGGISLKNISFRYADDSPAILHNVCLDIHAGESVAIVGPTGSGKTTLLKIMTSLIMPQTGQIMIDGRSLNEIGLQNFRKHIGVVMQEDHLFAGSIAENISFFDPNIDMNVVHRVAKIAHIHDEIVAMTMEYETLVGDMGSALSGGQVQRIMLARSLYTNPRILFLDEGTAHLDINTEHLVTEAITRLGITRIVVAHRTQTIKSAQRILQLVSGELREEQI